MKPLPKFRSDPRTSNEMLFFDNKCSLCIELRDRKEIKKIYFEDDDIIIFDCPKCSHPITALKNHGMHTKTLHGVSHFTNEKLDLISEMENKLFGIDIEHHPYLKFIKVKDRCFTIYPINHWHWHIRWDGDEQ